MAEPERRSQRPTSRVPERIPATEFKARCLELMDHVQRTRSEVIVTKHGKPVAKLSAVDQPEVSILGLLAGTIGNHVDLVEPTGVEWDADG
jgi:prevent-host-death family protein